MPRATRRCVFISYSHKDKEWLEKLQIHLSPLFRDSDITAWDDRQIQSGDQWHREISQALEQACVAVLLVSPDFLASDYIRTTEVRRLVEADAAGLGKILWIPVRSSAVADTEIARYQALSDPREPLASLNEAAQDDRLVAIARDIRRHVPDPDEPPRSTDSLQLLRALDVNLPDIHLCAMDERGRVWISNGQQLKIIPINSGQSARWRVLPNQRWKHCLRRTWRGGLVLSDWDGSLYWFSGEAETDDAQVHKARNDDLPMHLLELGPDGRLVTAAWNGLIRTWDADGKATSDPLKVPFLPLHIMPLSDGVLAVVDQANAITVYDADGNETWRWQAEESIEGIWSCPEQGRPAFAVLLGRQRVAKVGPGQRNTEEQRFAEPIECACLHEGPHGVNCLCVARKDGNLDWLSVSPFALIRGAGFRRGEKIRHIAGVPWTPLSPTPEPVAMGLTLDGRLFIVRRNRCVLYEEPTGIDRLMMDPSGRFLLLFSRDQVNLYRNPAAGPLACRIELVKVAGTLEVDASNRLTVTLKNSGPVAIYRVRGEMHGGDRIDSCRFDEPLARAVGQDETFTLEFSVRARIMGDAVALALKLWPEDEGGPCFSPVELRFNVVSHGKGKSYGD